MNIVTPFGVVALATLLESATAFSPGLGQNALVVLESGPSPKWSSRAYKCIKQISSQTVPNVTYYKFDGWRKLFTAKELKNPTANARDAFPQPAILDSTADVSPAAAAVPGPGRPVRVKHDTRPGCCDSTPTHNRGCCTPDKSGVVRRRCVAIGFVLLLVGLLFALSQANQSDLVTNRPFFFSISTIVKTNPMFFYMGSGFFLFVVYICCWTTDNDNANFKTNGEVWLNNIPGQIVSVQDSSVSVHKTTGEVEQVPMDGRQLSLAAPHRCADLVFRKVESDDGPAKQSWVGNFRTRHSICKKKMIDKRVSGDLICNDPKEINNFDRRFKPTDFSIDGCDSGMAKVHVKFQEQQDGSEDFRAEIDGEESYRLQEVILLTRMSSFMSTLFLWPSIQIAKLRRVWRWCCKRAFECCCSCASKKEASNEDAGEEEIDAKKEGGCFGILKWFGSCLLSHWQWCILAVVVPIIYVNKAGTPWTKLDEDNGKTAMENIDKYEKPILVVIGYVILVLYFSRVMVDVEDKASIGELPLSGACLVVLLGVFGKCFRFIINKCFVVWAGLKPEGSDDFIIGWLFIEAGLILTLYCCNIMLAAVGCDFRPTNINESWGHVKALGLDVLIKCLVALLFKVLYTYKFSKANSHGRFTWTWLLELTRSLNGNQLLALVFVTHVLLDLKQQDIAVNTPKYTAAWRGVIHTGKTNDDLGFEPFQYFVMVVTCALNGKASFGVGRCVFSSTTNPGFLATLLARVDEVVNTGIVVPALLGQSRLPTSLGEEEATDLVKMNYEAAVKSANCAHKVALMILARGDAMRTAHLWTDI